jgi:Fur family transcriptional regulator, peroxide stress response regulator
VQEVPAGESADRLQSFRSLCAKQGLAVTHQRMVIYEALKSMPGHPSPEEVFAIVREQVPSISLGTVYKTIHAFLDSGLLREVSLHHGTLRIEANTEPHHHLVCRKCRAVFDIPESEFETLSLRPDASVPAGFVPAYFAVEVIGLCERCSLGPS